MTPAPGNAQCRNSATMAQQRCNVAWVMLAIDQLPIYIGFLGAVGRDTAQRFQAPRSPARARLLFCHFVPASSLKQESCHNLFKFVILNAKCCKMNAHGSARSATAMFDFLQTWS